MSLLQEVMYVVFTAILFTFIGQIDPTFWAFLFAFLIAWPIASIAVRPFASGGKTMGSGGRYAPRSNVFLFLMIGIIAASYLGSTFSDIVIKTVNTHDFMTLFEWNLLACGAVWALVRSGIYG